MGNELCLELAGRTDENQRRETAERQARGQYPAHPVYAWHRILTDRYNPFLKAGLMAGSQRNSLVRWTLTAALRFVSPTLAQSSIGFVSLERVLKEPPAAQPAQKKLEEEFSQRRQDLSRVVEQLQKM